MKNFDFDCIFKVVSFKLSIFKETVVDLQSNSMMLTEEMKNQLNSLRVGERFIFHDIKVSMPDETVTNVGSLYFKVK